MPFFILNKAKYFFIKKFGHSNICVLLTRKRLQMRAILRDNISSDYSCLRNNYTFNFLHKPTLTMLSKSKVALSRYALVFLFQIVAMAAMAQNKTVTGQGFRCQCRNTIVRSHRIG